MLPPPASIARAVYAKSYRVTPETRKNGIGEPKTNTLVVSVGEPGGRSQTRLSFFVQQLWSLCWRASLKVARRHESVPKSTEGDVMRQFGSTSGEHRADE